MCYSTVSSVAVVAVELCGVAVITTAVWWACTVNTVVSAVR